MALSDNAFSREEGLIVLAIIACLSEKYFTQAEIYSTVLPNNTLAEKSQILYIEGEYYKEANKEISDAYREISNEFRLIGLNLSISQRYASIISHCHKANYYHCFHFCILKFQKTDGRYDTAVNLVEYF